MRTRQQLIEAGKIWQVYPDNDPDRILFEGSKTAARKYLLSNFARAEINLGVVRVGKLLWEAQ